MEFITERSRKPIYFLLTVLILGFMLFIIPSFIGFGKGGFSIAEVFRQFNLYLPFGATALLLVIVAEVAMHFIKKGESDYSGSIAFTNGGEYPSVEVKAFENPLKIYLLFFIIWLIIGTISFTVLQKQAFTPVGGLEQEFTAFDNALYGFSLIPTAENLGAAFLFAIYAVFLLFFARKKNLGSGSFLVFFYLGAVVLFAIYGGVNHQLRYGDSDIDLARTIGFWGFGGFITAMTGSFMPFLALHQVNNLFIDIKPIFTNEALQVYALITVVLLSISYWLLFLRGSKKAKSF